MTMTRQTGIRRELEAAPLGAAGASLRQVVDWRSIKWKQANRNVRCLQRRIVQAQQQGKKRKVRALQFILARSYSARCLAVRRVVENPGRCTPGVDGQKLDTPEKKAQAVEKLNAEDYQPRPLKRVYIAKKNGKGRRPLGIPTMDDRAHQALHLSALEPIAETTADPNSYGFRKERSVADAIEQCFTEAEWLVMIRFWQTHPDVISFQFACVILRGNCSSSIHQILTFTGLAIFPSAVNTTFTIFRAPRGRTLSRSFD